MKNLKLSKDVIQKLLLLLVIYISILLLMAFSSLNVNAQPIKGVSYETIESYTYLNGKRFVGYMPGIIFEFKGNKIIASTNDQTKNLYMRYEWEDTVLMVGNKLVKGKVVEAYDNGGFKCLINYMYDTELKLYVLTILYNNVNHIHFMKPSKKEARPDPIVQLPSGDMIDINYTDEEVKWFLENFRFLMGDFYSLDWLEN